MDMGEDSGGGNGGDSGDGEQDNKGDDMPKDAPLTTGALTGGGDRDNDEESSGGNRDSENDKDDDEPTSKDAPQTADTITANKPDCPKGQEYYLFSASCKPVGGSESPGNTGPANPTPTSCFLSFDPEGPDLSSLWGMEKEQIMKINRGVFYHGATDKGMQQQLSLFHQVQEYPGQLGKKYDPSSILSAPQNTNCEFKQAHNPDGSITATITRPGGPFKDVIKTDTTGKVVVQENTYDNTDKLRSSAALDNNHISTRVQYDDGAPGKNSIDITEPDGGQVSLVWWKPDDGSVQRIISEGIQHDDDDKDPTTATGPDGTKTTVKPFHAIDPYYIDVRNPDGSLETQMILNSDGTVEPGSRWTTPAR
jgi:hypothetical protein